MKQAAHGDSAGSSARAVPPLAMDLTDLIDLEAQLAWDRDADPARLVERDGAIARRLAPEDRADPHRAVAAWVGELRAAEPARPFPGRPTARALRILSAVLAVTGLLFGWGLATGLLAFDGSHPVNVMDFLWVVVGVQLLLLLLLVGGLLFPRAVGRVPLVGDLRSLIRWSYPRLARRLGGDARSDAWKTALHHLRTRRSLYARIEPWVLLGLTQVFGIAFNLGVFLALLRLVVLTDLAFAWSTTLDLDAATLHGIVEGLSVPWAWAFPDAAPSLGLVEATRYSRLEGGYLAGAGPVVAGGWWPFLVAATVTYGLLPRGLAWVVARARRAQLLARVPLDDVHTRRLLGRLTAPAVETRGLGTEPEVEPLGGSVPPPSLPLGGSCAAVLWRDVPTAAERLSDAVRAHFGCEVAEVVRAGGLDFASDQRAASSVGDGRAPEGGPVVIVAEAWEAPDRALLRFLRDVRAATAPRRPIVVGLVGAANEQGWSAPSEDDAQTWRDRVATLEDPFIGIESLEPTA